MIKDYLSYLANVRCLSTESLRAYEADLRDFDDFLRREDLALKELGGSLLRGYFAGLSEQKKSSATINRHMACLRGYFDFLERNEVINHNPLEDFSSFKQKRRLPAFWTKQELEDLRKLSGNGFIGARDRLIINLLYSTGCRVSELVAMNLNALKNGKKQVLVRGKGNKERFVFLGKQALQSLNEYLPLRKERQDRDDQDALFALLLNSKGKRISSRGVAWVLEQYAHKLGRSKKSSPHSFRHSFATHLVDEGADIRVVQELLGHSSLTTTGIYTHTGLKRLKKVYQEAHPHGKKAKRSNNT